MAARECRFSYLIVYCQRPLKMWETQFHLSSCCLIRLLPTGRNHRLIMVCDISALSLFVLRVLADNHDSAFSLDHLALFANRFHR